MIRWVGYFAYKILEESLLTEVFCIEIKEILSNSC